MKRFAHRGYSEYYPENTLEAFVKAYERGFDGAETDVHLTKDGVLVLCHDESIDRTSDGTGYIQDMTFEELRQYNFSYHFDGYHLIPTLEELLLFIKDKDFMLNIEIKTDHIQYKDIEQKVLDLVDNIGVKDQIIYSSFYLPSLLKVRELNDQAYIGYLMEEDYDIKYDLLINHQVKAFHPRHDFLNHETMKTLKEHDIFIATWTVKTIEEFNRLEDLGVDIAIMNKYI